jgi:hypothetical protein
MTRSCLDDTKIYIVVPCGAARNRTISNKTSLVTDFTSVITTLTVSTTATVLHLGGLQTLSDLEGIDPNP